MKLFAKILMYLTITLVLLLVSLVLVAEYAEGPISKLALNNINKALGSEISVKNIEFSLIKDFPNAQLQLQNVKVKSDSIGEEDIMALNNLYVEVEMMPLLKNQIKIIEIRLENGMANYRVYKNQNTNIDFLISDNSESESDSSSTNLSVFAPLIKTSSIRLNYKDDFEKINATVNLDAVSSVFMQETTGISANIEGSITIKDVAYPETKAHLMNQTQMDLKVKFLNDTVYVDKATLFSDGLQMKSSGWVSIVDNFPAQLRVYDARLDLKELSKYIPDSLITNYNLKVSGGVLSFEANINGGLLDTINLPQLTANVLLEEGHLSALDFPGIKQLDAELSFTNGSERTMASSEINLKHLLISTTNSQVKMNAKAHRLDQPVYSFESLVNLDLNEFNHLLPADLKTKVSGRVKASLSNSGTLPDSVNMAYIDYALNQSQTRIYFENLFIAMDSVIDLRNMNGSVEYHNKAFQFNNISCHLPEYDITIAPSNLKGNYIGSMADIDQLAISLDAYELKVNNSNISGSTYLKNGKKPYYKTNTKAFINIKDWSAFIPDTLVTSYSGELTADLQSKGFINPDSIVDEAMRLLFNESQITLISKNLHLASADSLMNLHALNGKVFLNNDSVSLENISGSFNTIDFSADSTSITDLYKSVLLNQNNKVKVIGFVHLGNIDYAELEKLMPKDTIKVTEVKTEPSEPKNYTFDIKGKFSVDQFKYQKAILENISGLYHLTDQAYIIDQFKFDTFKGHTNTSVKVQFLSDNVKKINFKNSTRDLDIYQLLVDFDDFKEYGNEDYINHNQLSGTFSTDNLNGYFLLKEDTLVADSTMISADLKLENGQLNQYPVAVQMGRDYNIDGLDDLHFKTIDTKIFVYSGTLYAPLTNIKTNTFDISFFGKQAFDLDCQYHLRFYLKEILRKGKTDRIEKKQSKEKKQKDDGGTKGLTSLFAIYKVENGKTVKSTLEKEGSKARTDMKIDVNLKEAMLKLQFHPLIVKYNTGVKDN